MSCSVFEWLNSLLSRNCVPGIQMKPKCEQYVELSQSKRILALRLNHYCPLFWWKSKNAWYPCQIQICLDSTNLAHQKSYYWNFFIFCFKILTLQYIKQACDHEPNVCMYWLPNIWLQQVLNKNVPLGMPGIQSSVSTEQK